MDAEGEKVGAGVVTVGVDSALGGETGSGELYPRGLVFGVCTCK